MVSTQKLCESRGGRPGLPVPNSPYGLCGRKATPNLTPESLLKPSNGFRAQELCESRDGHPGLPILNTLSVDVKRY